MQTISTKQAEASPLRGLAVGLLVLLAFLIVALGCSSEATVQFDHLELLPVEEKLLEIDLGQYVVPVPTSTGRMFAGPTTRRNRLQLRFTLHALVPQEAEPEVQEVWERRQGTVRDRVIQVCRNLSMEEIQERDMGTMKQRTLTAVNGLTQSGAIRRVVVSNMHNEEL